MSDRSSLMIPTDHGPETAKERNKDSIAPASIPAIGLSQPDMERLESTGNNHSNTPVASVAPTSHEPPRTQIPHLQSVIESLAIPDEQLPQDPHRIRQATPPPLIAPIPIQPVPLAAAPLIHQSPESSRQLDVTDALSYLDAVKFQFQDKPDVYNYFLDIMKDFKSQAIDTPGVIERVSILFRGHIDLIQGFNTFLPPGYRIECSTNPLDPNVITVTTPMGTTIQSTDENHAMRSAAINAPQSTAYNQLNVLVAPSRASRGLSALGPMLEASTSRPVTPQNRTPALPTVTSPMYGSQHAASFLGGLNQKTTPDKQQGNLGSEEFHHAIQFVNKIKMRYEDDTETYKQFLEILHTHRKESLYQNDSQVYAQVEVLFKDAPDLLEEFKAFLPSVTGTAAPRGDEQSANLNWSVSTGPERTDKRGGKASPAPPAKASKRRKKPIDEDATPAVPTGAKAGGSRAKKSKYTHNKADSPSPMFSQMSHPNSPAHTHAHAHPAPSHSQAQGHAPTSHLTVSTLPPNPVGGGDLLAKQADELQFFDRAKKELEGRDTYEEFLKLLNMFARDVINAKTLIERASIFLGDALLAQFKDLLEWDDKAHSVDSGPPGSIRSWESANRLPRETEERHGPSYRRLPLSETTLACSGRNEHCRSVLNDVWVSHPTWASEEAGFVSHKKNSYEEALHKSEEERHEYQFYIEIITRTIALLQPIQNRIQEMNAEERNAFRLSADFGGSSKSIYHRAIKKVYGRDGAGPEIIQALQDCPAVAVGVVLQRLKQKNEEWRRAQREWNRVWREVDARNFYKSLDHQGITFKANDKKNITAKNFVAEIEAARSTLPLANGKSSRKERSKKSPVSDSASSASSHSTSSKWHLEYTFADTAVLQDAIKMVLSFLDRSHAQYSLAERRALERTLRKFVPLVCMLSPTEFDAGLGSPVGGDDSAEGENLPGGAATEDGNAASFEDADDIDRIGSHNNKESSHGAKSSKSGKRSSGGSGNHSGGVSAGDLRKKLFRTAQEKASAAARARWGHRTDSRHESPTSAGSEDTPPSTVAGPSHGSGLISGPGKSSKDSDNSDLFEEGDEWIRLMPIEIGMDVDSPENGDDEKVGRDGIVSDRPFYSNTTFYTLLRLLQLLYSRLLLFKETAARLAAQTGQASIFSVNPVAEELGLVDTTGPGAVLTHAQQTQPQSQFVQQAGNMGSALLTQENDLESNRSRNPERPEAHLYEYLLDSCEKLFEGEIDQGTFEENMRYLFGPKAFLIFTVDKVIAALIKQVHIIVADSKCQELLSLLTKWRTKPKEQCTIKELIHYRREAEQYAGSDDHLYKIEWDADTKSLKIRLMSNEDCSVDVSKSTPIRRWKTYVDSYVSTYGTELLNERIENKTRRPFMNRTVIDEEGNGKVRVEKGMEVRISLGTYRVFTKEGTEDVVWRCRP